MVDLETLRREARGMAVGEFVQRHPGMFLLGKIPVAIDDEWSFSTDVRGFDVGERPTFRSLGGGDGSSVAPPPTPALWAVAKSQRNTWQRRISVGRATNNDIVVRHDSVSKLHAHFQSGGGALAKLGLGRTAPLTVVDAGSLNGTFLEGRRLREGEAEPIASGAQLRFGDVECQVLDAAALHTALRTLRF